ncbi:hypothetical protein FHW36_1181 [Chitinophaga polysaccharea]|uniref:DUF6876 domain-containing protein n=1 Tax=Chitinophaga polysaccharea TaxID=1293035 RepID=A0A561P0P9_9BACT|nr:DUF6876 family protein [Chitinophaga polysaccharea]TWF31707.1 hypothetical protein FHW36_1181 [Chitinophaga polysaccharea]
MENSNKRQKNLNMILATQKFRGTDLVFKHDLTGRVMTEGILEIRDNYKGQWLIDHILFFTKCVALESNIQVWNLVRCFTTDDSFTESFYLTCSNDQNEMVYCTKINRVDFPADFLTLHYKEGVLYLPGDDFFKK